MGNSEKTDLEDLLDEFKILEEAVDTNEERKKVRDVMYTAIQVTKTERMFGRSGKRIRSRGYNRSTAW